jgi:hypothetical protein
VPGLGEHVLEPRARVGEIVPGGVLEPEPRFVDRADTPAEVEQRGERGFATSVS